MNLCMQCLCLGTSLLATRLPSALRTATARVARQLPRPVRRTIDQPGAQPLWLDAVSLHAPAADVLGGMLHLRCIVCYLASCSIGQLCQQAFNCAYVLANTATLVMSAAVLILKQASESACRSKSNTGTLCAESEWWANETSSCSVQLYHTTVVATAVDDHLSCSVCCGQSETSIAGCSCCGCPIMPATHEVIHMCLPQTLHTHNAAEYLFVEEGRLLSVRHASCMPPYLLNRVSAATVPHRTCICICQGPNWHIQL